MENKYFHPLNSRYRIGYSVANALVVIGWIIRVLGIMAALGYLLFGILGLLANGVSQASVVIIGIAFGVSIGVLLWTFVVGTVFIAFGQLLNAVIDNSINTSPLLSNDEKAAVMRLYVAPVAIKEEPSSSDFNYLKINK